MSIVIIFIALITSLVSVGSSSVAAQAYEANTSNLYPGYQVAHVWCADTDDNINLLNVTDMSVVEVEGQSFYRLINDEGCGKNLVVYAPVEGSDITTTATAVNLEVPTFSTVG
ncbi:MAG: hypothetical protein IKE35_03985 [Lachnospiraceae bacterium]|nr:hypothetical protein [Lachnospiraceae bacterium]